MRAYISESEKSHITQEIKRKLDRQKQKEAGSQGADEVCDNELEKTASEQHCKTDTNDDGHETAPEVCQGSMSQRHCSTIRCSIK